jgi:aminoglycoside 3-N-acetyltransferase
MIYASIRRHLSQNRRNRLKSSLLQIRRATAPLLARWHGHFNSGELCDHLLGRLPADFEVLMVHSSMNAMYPMFRGTAFHLLEALVQLVGKDRTLAMPAFFFGGKSYQAEDAYLRRAIFDEARTRSEMGLLTELFRRRAGARRSLHPTHSVCALGPLADELVATHHSCGSTFGTGSPFEIMNRYRTVILGLGTRYFRVLTHIHTAEDLLGGAFPAKLVARPETPVTLVARDGSRYPYLLRLMAPDPALYDRRSELLAHMMPSVSLQEWTFHGVPLFAIDAATLTRVLVREALCGRTVYVAVRTRSGVTGLRTVALEAARKYRDG